MQLNKILSTVFKTDANSSGLNQAAWLVFRVVVSVMMVHNGVNKFEDIEGFSTAYVEVIGLPFPIFFSYLAATTELAASPLLALGLLTRPAALGLFSTMAVALYHHILVAGFSIPYLELSAVYASCFLFFVVNGPGKFSVDTLISNALTKRAIAAQSKQEERLEKAYQASNVKVGSGN
ncbi:MAG: DoxX family protein [Cyanobacteria bacterium]|jgi:putative oxidoreductase|nr:DoxX family protein [Cyanobacteriota bacterium]